MVSSNREHGVKLFPSSGRAAGGWGGQGCELLVCSVAVPLVPPSVLYMRHQAQVQSPAWSAPARGHRAWMGGLGGRSRQSPFGCHVPAGTQCPWLSWAASPSVQGAALKQKEEEGDAVYYFQVTH